MADQQTKSPARGRSSLVHLNCLADEKDGTKIGFKIQPEFSLADLNDYSAIFQKTGWWTKRDLVVAWLHLCTTSGYEVTRFDAERIGDHCLNSTFSENQRSCGVQVERRYTKQTGRLGDIDCCAYWMSSESISKAETYFGGYREVA